MFSGLVSLAGAAMGAFADFVAMAYYGIEHTFNKIDHDQR